MRILLAFSAGMTLMILGHILGWPYVRWLFSHNAPETHPDCAPKYRTCHNGVWTEGPW